ncbi:MAG: TolB family protein, partial [Dongiaceae bacterium]
LSPDGRWVAYSVSAADFQQDAFVSHLWLANTATGATFQLTRGDKSAGDPEWSPDSAWLAFTSSRAAPGDKNQIFAIRPEAGEAIQLTKFGDFDVVRRDYRHAHIWTFEVAQAMREPVAGTQRTKGTGFHAGAADWSPAGKQIAFSATVNPDLVKGDTSDIYVLTLADDSVQKIVAQAGSDRDPHWSPDGHQIAFTSAMGRTGSAAHNSRLAVVPAAGGAPRSVTDAE